jgi:HSP20 family protein
MDAGVLTISLAKKAEAQPKQIKVQVGSGAKQVEGQTAQQPQ